ncbi:2Fe-2S iron-sulfur cluster-binding protein [Cohnella lupini]|uniref:2Fe-2S ferredoxin n=1 Tax=Cohnella lupini TaxID=1294267 RepID=A0A3D9IH35_9BACL|nr:2Fe-2S iron-sulfur cluster-binding protein [Cohnella lupini]RED60466.1 2Fe-2S ferredoxin [Cohnella lupini]
MITLTGRTITKSVEAQLGQSLLTLAQNASVDWQFNCSRGTCARCRCLVTEGAELLDEASDAEWDRLGPDELKAGYRLACQAVVISVGNITAANKTYF